MTKDANPEELPKSAVAKRVVAAKRKYFVPDAGVTVEATSPEQAAELAKQSVKQEVGDA